MENKPASLFVAFLSETFYGMPPSLGGRQVDGPSSLPVVVVLNKLRTRKKGS